MKDKVTVLFLEINNIGGSFYSLQDMIQSMGDLIYPIVLFNNENDAYRKLRDMGIECLVEPYTRLLLDSSLLELLIKLSHIE